MVRIKEEPLTAQALNTFFKTIHKELDKADVDPEIKEHVNMDVVDETLHFVGLTQPKAPRTPLPILIAKDARPEDMLPTTMSELRKRMETAHERLDMVNDPMTDTALALLKEVSAKALRAAEREMSKAGLRSR